MATKVFLDTEFTGLHQATSLISMALVAETGEEFYAEFTDFNTTEISDWIQQNVISHLQLTEHTNGLITDGQLTLCKGTKHEIKEHLKSWLAQFPAIEIWADVPAYDWVLFCELFGGAMHVPQNIFYAPFDIATLFRANGWIKPKSKYEQDVNRQQFADIQFIHQHHALHDARMVAACVKKLMPI